MAELIAARTLAEGAGVRFPNESAEYRAARIELLVAEIELRRQTERVAALRRALPPGGEVTTDYRFYDENGAEIGLAEMFGDHRSLIVYNWMFGPGRRRPCPMCTAFLDGFAAAADNLRQRVGIAAVGRSPIERQLAFKLERGWGDLPLFQSKGDDFQHAYGGIAPDGADLPALNVFERDGATIRHFWGGEMTGSTADPGEDPRGAPEISLLWTMLDFTREGRGTDWYPSLSYR